MLNEDIQKIITELERSLDSKRFAHTMGVAYTAACIAMRYDYDMNRAYLAGLLHDCAKCLSHSKRLEYCKKNNIPVTDTETANPALLHAKVGADMCNRKYGIEDDEIYNAVLYHTTGHPNMSMLDKIIYIADYIEPNRCEAPNLENVRKQTFTDLDTALRTILSDCVKYLESSSNAIDPMTMQTYQFYINQE